jgi:hypothetical protein
MVRYSQWTWLAHTALTAASCPEGKDDDAGFDVFLLEKMDDEEAEESEERRRKVVNVGEESDGVRILVNR